MRKKRILVVLLAVLLAWVGSNLVIGALLMNDYPEKIWLHRCNSIEKLYEQGDEYPNVEVDVVFRKNRKFDVTHDVDTSFNLVLEPYFSYMNETDGKIWLDIKNLKAGNKTEILAELNKLVETYRMEKDELIIESSNWEALRLFTENGYYTSYYVAFDKPNDLSDRELDACIAELQKIVDGGAVRALSFPGWWYSVIKEELNRPIDLLTWRYRTTQLALLASHKGRQMLKDPQLKVILIKDKGDYHR